LQLLIGAVNRIGAASEERPSHGWIDLGVLDRARRLAYFIHRDGARALEITAAALSRMESMAVRQGRRFAYRPKKRRSKACWSELQLFQIQIYSESERYERWQEAAAGGRVGDGCARLADEDLLVRFLKHLVLIGVRRNSFHVTVALCRILYRYSTEETIAIYDLVTQDPERRPDDDYYRSRKGVLLRELRSRFDSWLTCCRGARGEERFRAREARDGEAELVRDCLARFTPWNTCCVVPERFDPWREQLPALHRADDADHAADADHGAEVNRIHTVLHPECFSRLTRVLGLDPPETRLAIPDFARHGPG
jgi:hypothetical protein